MIVPCHNYARFLPEALASIDQQTRPADEVVVVDDGSTDETPAVIEAARADRAVLIAIRHETARGLNFVRNAGVAASSGDLIVILDADDRLSPNYLESLAGALDDRTFDFAYPSVRHFGAADRWFPAEPYQIRRLMQSNRFPSSTMFRRTLFDANRGFRTELDGVGLDDWEFWISAVEKGSQGVPVPECWLEYRQHPGGSLKSISKRRVLDALLTIRRLHPRSVRRRDVAMGLARSFGWRALHRLGLVR